MVEPLTMLKIGHVKWKGSCGKHPKYDPATDGQAGIRGGCLRCEMLLEIHTEQAKLMRMLREFGPSREPKPKPKHADPPWDDRQQSLFDVAEA